MAAVDFHQCETLIPRFEAKDQISALTAAAYPHSKKPWQDRYHRSMHLQANPPGTTQTQGPEFSTNELASRLGRR